MGDEVSVSTQSSLAASLSITIDAENRLPCDHLYSLKWMLRMIGIAATRDDPKILRYTMYFNTAMLWCLFLTSATWTIQKYGRGDPIQYNVIGVQFWMLYSSFSYLLISFQMSKGAMVLPLLQLLSQPEINSFGRRNAQQKPNENFILLHRLCLQWILVSVSVTIVTASLTIYYSGGRQMIREYLPPIQSNADRIVFIYVFIANIVSPIPMIIVRIAAYFAEKRITGLILYVENEVDHHMNFHVPSLMSWYDDLYDVNITLSQIASPHVTCAILVLLPQAAFLLQVCMTPITSNQMRPTFFSSIYFFTPLSLSLSLSICLIL
jgi:hypothetical protein